MLNDEQILLKVEHLLEELDTSNLKSVNLNKFNEKVLREVSEDELRVVEDILDDLDGDKLSLANVFDEKMRIVINFPTINTDSDLGKFVDFFQKQEWLRTTQPSMVMGGVLRSANVDGSASASCPPRPEGRVAPPPDSPAPPKGDTGESCRNGLRSICAERPGEVRRGAACGRSNDSAGRARVSLPTRERVTGAGKYVDRCWGAASRVAGLEIADAGDATRAGGVEKPLL